jgi:hypothetical protein
VSLKRRGQAPLESKSDWYFKPISRPTKTTPCKLAELETKFLEASEKIRKHIVADARSRMSKALVSIEAGLASKINYLSLFVLLIPYSAVLRLLPSRKVAS